MIVLDTLEMKNFLSHSDSLIEFNSYDGLTLISGINEDGRYDSNGSGKSTILEGVYYALTGKTLRNLSADGVINRVVGSDCEVSLSFYIGDTRYQITRYRGHREYGNSVKFLVGDEDKTQRLPTDTQTLIDDLLDTPPDILVGVMLMGEGLSSKFTSLSDPDKKRMLEQTIRMTHNISLSDKQVSAELSKIQNEVSELSGYIAACERSIELAQSVCPEDYDGLIDERHDTESELSSFNEKLSEYDDKYTALFNKLSVLNTTIEKINRLNQMISGFQSRQNELESRISSVSNSENPICPTCGQVVDNTKRLLESLNSELKTVRDQVEPHIAELNNLPGYDILNNKKVSIEGEISSLSTERENVRSKLSEINRRLSEIQTSIVRIEQAASQSSDLSSQIAEAKSKLVDISLRKESLEYIHKKIFSSTGIISDILLSVIEFIDSRLSVYTNILLDKPMTIEMNSKGKISLKSLNGEYTYNSLSNGEKRRLDISIQFALHDYCYLHCGLGLDTLFIDEVLDTLDSIGVSNILHVLKLKMDFCNLSRIFVITHNNDLSSYFDSSIVVSKDSTGNTRILN